MYTVVHTCQPSCNPLHVVFIIHIAICTEKCLQGGCILIPTLLPATPTYCHSAIPIYILLHFHLCNHGLEAVKSEVLKSPNSILFQEPLSCVHDNAVVFHQFCCCLANHSRVHDQYFSIIRLLPSPGPHQPLTVVNPSGAIQIKKKKITGSLLCAIISFIATPALLQPHISDHDPSLTHHSAAGFLSLGHHFVHNS